MKVYVVIPCYRVKKHIKQVIDGIGPEIDGILVVDDCCPEASGDYVDETITDPRVTVLRHEENQGVGGAVMTGYRQAMSEGADICVKVDGDGQMDPRLIPGLVKPILDGRADYVKGNRFFSLSDASSMPRVRLFGNTALSFLTKLSSGYWSIFDPTNGFTALHRAALENLPLDKIDKRYFFETSMLIELGAARAKVVDMPMKASYGDEESGLKIKDILLEFARKHLRAILRRTLYQYYVRDFSLASLQLPLGFLLTAFGVLFGGYSWAASVASGIPATSGTVILSAVPMILGVQFILSFFAADIASEPSIPLQSFDARD